MAAQVLSFFQRSPRYAPKPADWTQQELAEFYRVESALIRAGICVGTDRGLSDENEPWFIFYRADDGEVVIHFARIDGEYLIAGPAYEEIARGFDFSALVRNMVARHPLIRRSENNSNLSIHPAALLVAVVGTAFFKTGEARAAESGQSNAASGHARPVLLSSSSNAGLSGGAAPIAFQQAGHDTVQLPVSQAVLVLAAAMFASDYGVDAASLQPTAQAAIAAAAASLDFGPIGGATPGAEAAAILPAATHAVAADSTPAQMVSSVLSLVAVLSSLPQIADTSNANDSLAAVAAETTHHDTLNALPVSNEAANWTIDVRLGLALSGLPSVEAVQLIRGAIGEAGAQKISVIEVAKLPDVLAELIAKGEHFNVAPVTAPQTLEPIADGPTTADGGSVGPSTPAQEGSSETIPTQTPTGGSGGSGSGSGGSGSGGSGGSDGTTLTPIGAAPTPADPHHAFADPALVKQFIDFFIAHTNSIEVMVKGTEIVMFDSNVLHDVGAINHLTSMTFEFADGGMISLVGNHSSFLDDGILV